jgi:hypothetical protein
MHAPVIYGIMDTGVAAACPLLVQVAPDDFNAMQRLRRVERLCARDKGMFLLGSNGTCIIRLLLGSCASRATEREKKSVNCEGAHNQHTSGVEGQTLHAELGGTCTCDGCVLLSGAPHALDDVE